MAEPATARFVYGYFARRRQSFLPWLFSTEASIAIGNRLCLPDSGRVERTMRQACQEGNASHMFCQCLWGDRESDRFDGGYWYRYPALSRGLQG